MTTPTDPKDTTVRDTPDSTGNVLFDEAALMEVVGDDAGFVAELLWSFTDVTRDRLTELLNGVNRNDCAAVAALAHTIKGAAASIAAPAIAAAAATVETEAKLGILTPAHIEALRLAYRHTICDLAVQRYTSRADSAG